MINNKNEVCIVGVGTWLPEKLRLNSDWPPEFINKKKFHKNEKIDLIFDDVELPADKKTAEIVGKYFQEEISDPFIGSIKRYIADDNTEAAYGVSIAALKAIENAGLTPDDIDLLMCHDLVPDKPSTYNAPRAANLIGLKNAKAMSVDTACSSIVTHLEIAKAYIKSGLAENVLITESHLVNRAFPMMHPAAPGIGDGAGAMVISKGNKFKIKSTYQRTHPEFCQGVIFAREKEPKLEIPWYKAGGDYRIGSHNSNHARYMMQETVTFGAKTIENALRLTSYKTNDIKLLLSVQPRSWIPGSIAERLGLPREIAHETYKEIAHLGAAGVIFNFQSALNNKLFVDNSIVAIYAQGSGFTRAAAIIEV